MAWVSDWRLTSACSNAGILGTLATGHMKLNEIRVQIKNTIESTGNPFAVNIPLLRSDAIEVISYSKL